MIACIAQSIPCYWLVGDVLPDLQHKSCHPCVCERLRCLRHEIDACS